MCRTTDYPIDRDRLKVRTFFVRFSGFTSGKLLPESLTLLYLPRINENPLEVDGSKIRPESSAFVTLYRLVNAKVNDGEAVFGSRELVRVSEGVRFEVYMGEDKVLKGIFRKDGDQEWKLECKCGLEGDIVGADVSEVEVCVAVEGKIAMSERVTMVVKRKRNRRRFNGLEEIPEVREADPEIESDGCICCHCGFEIGDECEGDLEKDVDVEGVRWAVDVGIWVVCLGVGFLVSKASVKSLRRRRIF